MNKLENEGSSKIVDALINYETVKVIYNFLIVEIIFVVF